MLSNSNEIFIYNRINFLQICPVDHCTVTTFDVDQDTQDHHIRK